MESIKAIQAQNIYKVNPVTFNPSQREPRENNIFAGISGFNLNYPAAQNETTANSLDLLA